MKPGPGGGRCGDRGAGGRCCDFPEAPPPPARWGPSRAPGTGLGLSAPGAGVAGVGAGSCDEFYWETERQRERGENMLGGTGLHEKGKVLNRKRTLASWHRAPLQPAQARV